MEVFPSILHRFEMIFTDVMDVVDANRETLTDHRPLLKAQSFMEPSNARSLKHCISEMRPENAKNAALALRTAFLHQFERRPDLQARERQATR